MGKPLGILGGTFDPIHYGHLRPAREVMRALELAEIRLLPAADPPHRARPAATPEQRLRMVELAIAGEPGMRADERELERGGPSYTVLTLESLRRESEASLCLLLGLDAFDGIETWHQWRRIPELAHLVVMTRPGWTQPADATMPEWARARLARAPQELARAGAGRIYFQTVTPQDISATRIRAAVARGEPVDGLLPPAVLDYIRVNRLYLDREI